MCVKLPFHHVSAVLPKIEKAYELFEQQLAGPVNRRGYLENICKEFNQVALEAVEAIYLDTKEANSRETIFSAYGQPHPSELTLLGNNPPAFLRRIVETGRLNGKTDEQLRSEAETRHAWRCRHLHHLGSTCRVCGMIG